MHDLKSRYETAQRLLFTSIWTFLLQPYPFPGRFELHTRSIMRRSALDTKHWRLRLFSHVFHINLFIGRGATYKFMNVNVDRQLHVKLP